MTPESILHSAASAEVGIRVRCESPQKLRGKLYSARRKEQRRGNHAFDEMSFFELPDGETLFIVQHQALREWNERRQSD